MKNIKRWLSQRDQSLEKTASAGTISLGDFMDTLEAELGPEGRQAFGQLVAKHVPFIISQQFAPDHMGLHFLKKYLTVPGYRKDVLEGLPSNFHRQLLEKQVQEFGQWASVTLQNLTLHDLNKAVAPKDWKRVSNKHNPESELTVDSKPHLTQFPVHPEHLKMLNSEMVFPQHKLEENGIFAKMVHEIEDTEYPHTPTTYMAKPYHKKIESATKSWVKHPILGWATMATKALFNAGDIGHLCEDVSTHEHEGVPLTVHKFAHGHEMGAKSFNANKYDIHPSDIHKIGVMDYLTNNLDRHAGNVLIGDRDEEGHHKVLAIDHERNMQYSKILRDGPRAKWMSSADPEMAKIKETPMAYIDKSALKYLHNGRSWYSHENLVDWWSKNGRKIKDEMENQVGSIKDEAIRNHVRDNFNNRWRKMNNWASLIKDSPEDDKMYELNSLHNDFEDTRNTQLEAPKINASQLKSLPKNKRDALAAISDIVNKKGKLTQRQRSLLSSAVRNTIDSMTPDEAGEAFRSLAENPYLETNAIRNEPDVDPRNQMLRRFSESNWDNNSPTFKYAHLEAMANAIDSLPPQKKEILKHWADHYRRLLSERQAA
jgi:hypothetical protein